MRSRAQRDATKRSLKIDIIRKIFIHRCYNGALVCKVMAVCVSFDARINIVLDMEHFVMYLKMFRSTIFQGRRESVQIYYQAIDAVEMKCQAPCQFWTINDRQSLVIP